MPHLKKILLTLCLLSLLTACGSKSNKEFYARQDVDFGYISRIAVVPFENNTADKFAAERVRDMAITQTLAFGLFDVVDKGVVDSALREEAIDLSKNTLNPTDLKRLGQLLKVEAFMLGTVDQAGNVQRGSISYPQLALTLRLVDNHSGMIIWQVSGSKTGQTYGKRLFGIAADDEFKVSLKLLRELLATIPSSGEVLTLPPAEEDEVGAPDDLQPDEAAPIDETEEVEEGVEILPEQG